MPDEQIEKITAEALEQTVWPGRMEVLADKPFLLVDGAHNSNGVMALKSSLEKLYPGEKFVFFMGVMAKYCRLQSVLLLSHRIVTGHWIQKSSQSS